MNNPQQEVMQHLAKAPALVFLIVAAADGTIDSKEIKQFGKILKDKAHEPLFLAMQESGMSMADIIFSVKESHNSPIHELELVRQILEKLMPSDIAQSYKLMLLMLAKSIAEASGGFLGIFGSKISKEEKIAIAAIASVLGVLENARTGETTVTASNSGSNEAIYHSIDDLPDNVFPALKPAVWGKDAKGSVAMGSIFETGTSSEYEPVIGYAIDSPESIVFINSDMIANSLALSDVHTHALKNLESRLANAVTWETLEFDTGSQEVPTVSGLCLNGNYYCSEAMLSETLLRQAHDKLDSAMIMVMAPVRGELFACKLVSEQNAEPERLLFASFAIKRYFNPEQAAISPNVWISRNGKIVGHVGGMAGMIAIAKKHGEAEMQQEDEQLLHQAVTFADGNGIGILVNVEALDIGLMIKNLQHVIRGYIQAGVENRQFTGLMNVVLNIKDTQFNADMKKELANELDSLFEFLNKQFQSLGFKGMDNSTINVSYELNI